GGRGRARGGVADPEMVEGRRLGHRRDARGLPDRSRPHGRERRPVPRGPRRPAVGPARAASAAHRLGVLVHPVGGRYSFFGAPSFFFVGISDPPGPRYDRYATLGAFGAGDFGSIVSHCFGSRPRIGTSFSFASSRKYLAGSSSSYVAVPTCIGIT